MNRPRLLIICLLAAAATSLSAQTQALPTVTTPDPTAQASTPTAPAPASVIVVPPQFPPSPVESSAPALSATPVATPVAALPTVPVATPAPVPVSAPPTVPVATPVPAASPNPVASSAPASPTAPVTSAPVASPAPVTSSTVSGQVWSAAISLPATSQPLSAYFAAPTGVVAAASAGPTTLLQVPANCTAANLNVTLSGSMATSVEPAALAVTLVAIDTQAGSPSLTNLTCTVNSSGPSMTTCSDSSHQVPLFGGELIGFSVGTFATQAQISAFLPSTIYASFTCQ